MGLLPKWLEQVLAALGAAASEEEATESKLTGKLTPFQSPASEQDGSVKLTEEERKSATADEKLILGMFKQEGKCDFVPSLDLDELGNYVAGDGQGARKKKNPFEAEVYLAG
ncbi:unnamed protein product [Vicia faba]|uniref:Uncharacterized protein n=1 Tax=Vicia faba TaxID=3906 RepID=A0AAV0ZVV3_VICFA|nr:unnamed protein product [Vicia faba]